MRLCEFFQVTIEWQLLVETQRDVGVSPHPSRVRREVENRFTGVRIIGKFIILNL